MPIKIVKFIDQFNELLDFKSIDIYLDKLLYSHYTPSHFV